MKNMMNTDEYNIYRHEQAAVFRADYLRNEETHTLSSKYQLKKRSYLGTVDKYTLHATENDLLDTTGKVLYTYQNLNDDCEFQKIIMHRDGSDYLIFRTDLYGYSVLNLTTYQDFHYIPSGSFPSGETFIWTDVFYNAQNNILAVSGCYWGCTFGILLQDFTHPMENPDVWIDIQEQIENGYDCYDDVNFVEWQGTDLILQVYNSITGEKETISISDQEYGNWLKKA